MQISGLLSRPSMGSSLVGKEEKKSRTRAPEPVGERVEPRGLYKFQMPSSTDPESTFVAVWDDR
ncbi:MAG: hypothetical protein IKQ13_11045 [Treponema sp.]|nr:hypothetical protein [Treponema sp.]